MKQSHKMSLSKNRKATTKIEVENKIPNQSFPFLVATSILYQMEPAVAQKFS